MRVIAYRIGVLIAACVPLLAGMPTGHADPVTLPPMTPGGGGPIIGGGNNAGIAQQLTGLSNPNVQEVRTTTPDSARAPTGATTGNGEARCSSPPRAPHRTSTR